MPVNTEVTFFFFFFFRGGPSFGESKLHDLAIIKAHRRIRVKVARNKLWVDQETCSNILVCCWLFREGFPTVLIRASSLFHPRSRSNPLSSLLWSEWMRKAKNDSSWKSLKSERNGGIYQFEMPTDKVTSKIQLFLILPQMGARLNLIAYSR
jgi:hypothetical protein